MQEFRYRHDGFLGEFKRTVGVSDRRNHFEVHLRLRAVQEVWPVTQDH